MKETTTGAPLTATVGERLGGDPHVGEVREQVERAAGGRPGGAGERRPGAAERPGGRAARPFPWGKLAAVAIGWMVAARIGRGVRAAARGVAKRAERLARR